MKPVYEIDGNRFSTLEEFYEEVSRVPIPAIPPELAQIIQSAQAPQTAAK